MNEEKVNSIIDDISKKFEKIQDLKELNNLKVEEIGKKGRITILQSGIKDAEDKKSYGMMVNKIKKYFNDNYDSKLKELELIELNKKLESEKIDITLPATRIRSGSPNILEKTVEDMENLFMSLGYDVVEGPEIEEDLYNFELLNLPKGHPARDSQDTFYLEGDKILLRSHTSPVQARTMLEGKGEKPIRVVCPGKTYRRDEDDATHSHNFMQIEGLLVDKHATLADLKGTFDVVAKHLFGDDCITRFRPSYYPFTEPSVETDISCFKCKGEGCPICKNTGWITISGAGVVHPNVLKMCGYDPSIWHGFAFGFGLERIAMLKYGINDIRTFYNTDLRESKVFDRRED